MLEEALKLRTPQMHAALALDLNTGLRDKELREIRWEQIDLIHKKALAVRKSKTEAGTGRVIPLNETAMAAMDAHAAWYSRRFGECRKFHVRAADVEALQWEAFLLSLAEVFYRQTFRVTDVVARLNG